MPTHAAGAILVDARGRQHGVPKRAAPPPDNTWLHVSGLDRFVEGEQLAAALAAALRQRGAPAAFLRCDVAGFADDDAPPYTERRRRDQGKCHQGWALLQFGDEAAAAGAASALHGLRLAGAAALTAAPARSRAALSAPKQAQADAEARVTACAAHAPPRCCVCVLTRTRAPRCRTGGGCRGGARAAARTQPASAAAL
jgi:hypothetical protein